MLYDLPQASCVRPVKGLAGSVVDSRSKVCPFDAEDITSFHQIFNAACEGERCDSYQGFHTKDR
jgi:hypothetical protein